MTDQLQPDLCETKEQSRKKYERGYYVEKLEQGNLFQDVVAEALYYRGIVLLNYASRHFQRLRGENMQGIEIKRDDKFRETKNLYIEVAEKTHPDNDEYIGSAIYRQERTWLLAIGDERTIYVFPTKLLKMLIGSRDYRKVSTPTSIGYLMPLVEADKYCATRIDLEATDG
jgi:hypothetical protein